MSWGLLARLFLLSPIPPDLLMDKRNGLYFSPDMYCSRQHTVANCPRILSGFESCFVLLNAGYGNGLTNAYAGTVLLLADNPLLI